jgi:hypothetical protein
MVELGSRSAIGEAYGGRSSPFWYDAAAFHELLLAAGAQPVRSLVAQLDGCTGAKAGEIVGAAGLERVHCQDVSREEATRLLEVARQEARPVNPRLARIGKDLFACSYATRNGTAMMGSTEPQAEIPYVVEAWAVKTPHEPDFDLQVVLVNRTPITAELNIWRAHDKDLVLQGCGIDLDSSDAPKKGGYAVVLSLITPYCPITSDGKALTSSRSPPPSSTPLLRRSGRRSERRPGTSGSRRRTSSSRIWRTSSQT